MTVKMTKGSLLVLIVYLSWCQGLDPLCGPYWNIIGHNYCYKVGGAQVTWSDANKACLAAESTLIRLYDNSTVADLQTLLMSTNDTRWWTDLNDMANPQDWMFGTGADAVYPPDPTVFQWVHEPDDNGKHLQNCGALNFQGSVSDERCSDHYRYICEYTNTQGGNCSQGWRNYSTSCYLFPSGILDPWSTLSWSDANKKCQGILAGTTASGMTSHLLFLETKDEQNYLQNQLPLVSLTTEIWWIGMTDIQTEGQFKWTDGTPVGTSVFWVEEPNNLGANERCVYANSRGAMADYNCKNLANYICMKESDVDSVMPGLGCPSSWTRAGRYCYLVESYKARTWNDARATCNVYGADLVKVDSLDKKMWIESQNSIFESGLWFWTGLKYRPSKTWGWADGSTANMSLIMWVKEPNNYKGQENCAIIRKNGQFNDVSCNLEAGYICEFNAEDSGCPAGWLSLNVGDFTDCLYFGIDKVTFRDAHAKCNAASFPSSSYLAAISNKQQLDFIKKHLQGLDTNIEEFYTGLVMDPEIGFWRYDTSWNPPPTKDLINWAQYPQFNTGSENCGTILFGAQYINVDCNDKHTFICERLAYGVQANAGNRIFSKRFSPSSVLILFLYFIVYGICLHYILHLTYVLFPAYA